MITIVYSTRKDNLEYQKHIRDTVGLKDIEILQYVNEGEFSLTEIYNKGLKEASHPVICFIHDDLLFEKDSKWGRKVLKHFNSTDYGILGKAGTTSLTESGKWWEESHLMIGSVYHTHTDPESGKKATWESRYSGLFHNKIVPVILVDGLFIAVHRERIKKGFDEDVKGFHFYDLHFSIANHFAGVKIGVMFDFKLTHKSIGMTNEQWDQNRRQFIEKWAFYTDDQGNKHLGLPVSIEPTQIEVEPKHINLKKEPKVAVIIPTKDKFDYLERCLESFHTLSNYSNYKIYIADTGSSEEEIKKIEDYISMVDPGRYKLLKYNYYNFARINNDVVRNYVEEDTEVLLFCNNDIELLNDALSIVVDQYVKHKQDVGTIGVRLHYPNKMLQHGGVVMGVDKRGQLMLTHRGLRSFYNYEPEMVYNVFGSTGAFLLIPKVRFDKSGGFNEEFKECFEDVVLNLQQILDGKINIFCGDAVCIHYESITRGEGKQERETGDFNNTLVPFIKKHINNEKVRRHLKMV
jgi:GT2 family glycosyltransferase